MKTNVEKAKEWLKSEGEKNSAPRFLTVEDFYIDEATEELQENPQWSQCNDCFDDMHDKCSGGRCACPLVHPELHKPQPKECEHNLGLLYGAQLVLKTDDEKVIEYATKFLGKLAPKMPTDEELQKEVDEAFGLKHQPKECEFGCHLEKNPAKRCEDCRPKPKECAAAYDINGVCIYCKLPREYHPQPKEKCTTCVNEADGVGVPNPLPHTCYKPQEAQEKPAIVDWPEGMAATPKLVKDAQEECEHDMGLLYGAKLVLKTDDEEVIKHATKFLEKLAPKLPTDEELRQEVDIALGIRPSPPKEEPAIEEGKYELEWSDGAKSQVIIRAWNKR